MSTRNVLKKVTAIALASGLLTAVSAFAENEEIIDRVKPVGNLVVLEKSQAAQAGESETTSSAAPAAMTASSGKADYDAACMACHATGAAGAPIVGNKDAWAARVEQGKDTLYNHAINGFNAMPPKGGAAHLSDEQIKAIVDYMVDQVS
jgi:cytochrome c5